MNFVTTTPNPIPILIFNVVNDIFSSTCLNCFSLTLLTLLSTLIRLYFWCLHGYKGYSHKHLFLWNKASLNVLNCLPIGIGPQRLLDETLRDVNQDNRESSWGIQPLKLFRAKSNCSKADMLPRDKGIYMSNSFLDKFNNHKTLRVPMLAWISPIKLLLDKSSIVFVHSTYGKLYTLCFMSILSS